MKKLQAKENYVFVKKDKSEIYGNLIYTPDSFDETSLIEVIESEAEAIKKAIEEEMEKKYQYGLNA